MRPEGAATGYTEHLYQSHDGLSLYYRSYGSGEDVVVCLHGMSRNSKDFEDLAEHLCGQWRVITPDLRGRGRSAWDPDPDNYHPSVYVKDIWTLLDSLGVGRFVVIGTSLGGLIAMLMAPRGAGRLRALILNDTAPEIPPDAAARIIQYVGRTPPVDDWNAAVAQARQNYGLALPGLSNEFWHSYVRSSYREDGSGKIVPDMDPAIGVTLRKSALGGLDPWKSFSAVTMPCLLLRGARSDVLTTETAERMRRVAPDLELVIVPDRGHAPLLDEAVSRSAIDEFLNRL